MLPGGGFCWPPFLPEERTSGKRYSVPCYWTPHKKDLDLSPGKEKRSLCRKSKLRDYLRSAQWTIPFPVVQGHRLTMKSVLFPLLAAALCLHAAHSLICYTCLKAEKNSDCLSKTECTSDENYCETTVGSAFGKNVIIKQCAPVCASGEGEFQGMKVSISCCQADLCNYSGATSVKISFLALLVPAGFVLSLLRGWTLTIRLHRIYE
ncbi:lymphocyte antigen 6E-like isoform X2 [Rhinatrema bivittatum]|uniref:lymphocyte antigen 6E-like isoform X2 n=1 Tax=Rhinatrema bivittatum TaxID=194408 RepID=UPI0011296E4C|nr:lymphocyte antigen 6E-like isoform X2 [Rhinatrema bivittatum]